MSNNYEKHKTEVVNKYVGVRFSNLPKAYIELDKLYQYARNIQNEYFFDGKLDGEFNYIADYIKRAEESLTKEFIVESRPVLDINCDNKNIRSIIINVRNKLFADRSIDDPLIDECSYGSNLVYRCAREYDLNARRVIIYPGFTKEHSLLHFGSGFHAFNIVTANNEDYIIDLTYRQFFLNDRNSLERIGVCGLFNTLPGRFMTMNDSRMRTASKLLKDGYIEMTDENIKNYFDGFALSYRNATYYDETNDFSFITNYSPYDYMRFINEEDSQLNHEGIYRLGYQKKVLRKPDIRFNKVA